jgi:hypothetical protein
MTDMEHDSGAMNPRWDGRRMLFDLAGGDGPVPCAISLQALQDLSPRRRFKPAELLLCFAEMHQRITAIAQAKLRARPAGSASLLNIWSDDLDASLPATAKPLAARVPAAPPRRPG